MRRFLGAALLCVWALVAAAQQSLPPKPGPKDLCPVCGMLVAKYPNWTATIVYRDGHAHHFDGAKDMFKFWFDPPKYAAGHSRAQIARVYVTDYYDLRPVDAQTAFYVIGSDVYGPMGYELVPLATRAAAEDFMKEHKGKRILGFGEVDAALVERVDSGKL